jgi:hypothetical protein
MQVQHEEIAKLAYQRWRSCAYRRQLYDWQTAGIPDAVASLAHHQDPLTDDLIRPFAQTRYKLRAPIDAVADWNWAERKLNPDADLPVIKPFYNDYWD